MNPTTTEKETKNINETEKRIIRLLREIVY
jgi:hypothetical protein